MGDAGGRPERQESKHFKRLPELGTAKGGYSYRECKFCRAAFQNEVTTTPPKPIIGRVRNYQSHLAKCTYYKAAQLRVEPLASLAVEATPDVVQREILTSSAGGTPSEVFPSTPQPVASQTRSQSRCAGSRTARPPHARRSLMLEKRPSPGITAYNPTVKKTKKEKRRFSKSEIRQIECYLIELHADNRLPDRFIEQASVLRFLELLCPGISDVLPSRRTLGGRILKEHASRCKTTDTEALKAMAKATNGWVNLLSDVWQNISKEHLLGCQLSLFGILLTYALLPAGDEHHGIAIAKQLEQVLDQAQLEGWRVGAMATDNAGQCGRARRILAIRWPEIVFLFCFAHDVNNLVKAVLKTSFNGIASKAATAVNILNASSSKWLPRAQKIMKKFYGRSLGLRTLCETRWNSMQGCLASLLRVQSALQTLYRQYKTNCDFPSQLRVFGESLFWEELKEAEAIIAPLSYASFRLQRDENTLGDVVQSFREIYEGFQQHLVRRDKLVECVEHRWEQCEQPLFMLGFALHPVYAETARALPETAVSGTGTLCKIAVYYFRRLFATEDIGEIRRDMLAWMKGRFTRTKPSEFPNAPWEYWECVATERPKSLLPTLAMRILSIAVNTATCERLFSELGVIHTAKRNRMAPSKALDYHIIAKHVRNRSKKSDTGDPRKKLLISPIEREIIMDATSRSSLFEPSPQQQGSSNADDDSDDDDPGDGVDGTTTLTLWGEFLDEVFEDEEIDAGYTENEAGPELRALRELREDDLEDENELENIPSPIKHEFPAHNDRNFPQEALVLQGFRGRKSTLTELFV